MKKNSKKYCSLRCFTHFNYLFLIFYLTFFTSQAQVQLDATGSGNAFVVTYPAVIVSAPNGGIEFTFRSNQNITGAATLNLNSTGARPILKNFDQPLVANDIKAGHFVRVIYDASSGGQWQMVSVSANPLPSGALAGGGVAGGVGFFSNATTVTSDGANLFFDNTSKRLGIGTAAPGQMLHVRGSNAVSIIERTSNGNWASLDFVPSGALSGTNPKWSTGLWAGQANYSIYNNDGVSDVQRLTIRPNGNVGIGTISPLNSLDVAGSIAMGAYAGVNTPPANSLIVSGNIGIGQNSPIHKLHVNGGNIFTDQAYIASTRSVAASTLAFNSGTLPISQIRITDNGTAVANGNFTYGTTAIEGQYLWITNFDNESVTFISAFAPNVIPPYSTRCFVFIGGSQWNMVGAQSDNLGNHTATTQIRAIDGTASLPSYTFNNNPSTGMYLINTNIVGIATGGTNRILYDGFGHSVTPPSANGFTINVGGASAFGLYGTVDASAANAPVNGLVVSGNVGIGTSTPGQNLVVVGNTSVTGNSTISGTSVSTNARVISLSNGVLSVNGSGNMVLAPAASSLNGVGVNGGVTYWSGANTLTNDGTNFFWDNTNKRLGVGTNVPQRQFHLKATSLPSIILEESGQAVDTRIWGMNVNGSIFYGFASNDAFSVTNNWIEVNRTGSTVSRVSFPNGNVGIGTNNPNTKLDVNGGAIAINNTFNNNTARPAIGTARVNGEIAAYGTSSFAADDGFMRLSAGGGTSAIEKTYIDLSAYSQIQDMNKNIVFGVNGVERMRIINGGNVGIGTSTPIFSLDIRNQNNTGNTSIRLNNDNASRLYTGLTLSRLGNEKWFVGMNGSDDNYVFRTNTATDLITINQNGNVGIGTNTPSERLDVVGNAEVTGEYKYATPKVRFKSYSHVEFDREGNNTIRDFDFGSYGTLTTGTPGNNQTMYTLLDLPDGATVTGLYFNYVDDDATYNFSDASIWRTNATAGMALGYSEHFLISSITDFAATTIAEVSSLSSTLIIDNNSYAYILRYLTSESSANLKFVRMKVRYQVSDAD